MKRISLLLFSTLILSTGIFAQYSLPTLSYEYNSLEPYIDSTTMYIHYNNHHAAYVNNLNAALKNYPELQKKSLIELLLNLHELPRDIQTVVRNNGGGHYNHTLFWSLLAPAGSTKMSNKLKKELEKNFKSVDAFKNTFEKAATSRFGSGWAWLIKDNNGKLHIVSTANQDNPNMSVAEAKGTPILALDVWEHAYYLKYQSKRADYIKAFWKIVNWSEVERLLDM